MKESKKVFEQYVIYLNLNASSCEEFREKIVHKFLNEKKGYRKGDEKHITKYKYIVETLKDGRHIYLIRPAPLNKGMDFQVWVEKMYDNKDVKPSYEDILNDLRIKKEENPIDFYKLIKLIESVWNCTDPNIVLKNVKLNFRKGLSLELLLKILKWLFIEQDIAYWNYDGRNMLMSHINDLANSW